jgi:predicted N-acetyltransferase YhbS
LESIIYNKLDKSEIKVELFSSFNRYQEVRECWRKENGEWLLKQIEFTEQWSPENYEYLVKCLQNTLKEGGMVFGAFCNNALVGFASLENRFFGSQKEYLQLSSIHASYESRGLGIGKNLFSLVCKKAKERGAKKIYISAHSSKESQAFYKAMGCVEATEYNSVLAAKEPCDCQLEYIL